MNVAEPEEEQEDLEEQVLRLKSQLADLTEERDLWRDQATGWLQRIVELGCTLTEVEGERDRLRALVLRLDRQT